MNEKQQASSIRLEYRPNYHSWGSFSIIKHWTHRNRPANVEIAKVSFEESAQLIVDAVNDRPGMLARIAELEAENAQLRDAVEASKSFAKGFISGFNKAISNDAIRIYNLCRKVLGS